METTTEQEKMASFQSAQGLVPEQITIVCCDQLVMYKAI